MAASTSSLSLHTPKNCLIVTSSRNSLPAKEYPSCINCQHSEPSKKASLSLAKTAAVAGAVVTTLASSPWAMAAKQIAESPQDDNRGLALLLPIVPAVGWVLFNILRPALNQLNRMRSEKAVIFGLGGLAAYHALYVQTASAASEAIEGEAAAGGSSGLLPFIVAGAVGLEVVLFSTMQSKYEEKSH